LLLLVLCGHGLAQPQQGGERGGFGAISHIHIRYTGRWVATYVICIYMVFGRCVVCAWTSRCAVCWLSSVEMSGSGRGCGGSLRLALASCVLRLVAYLALGLALAYLLSTHTHRTHTHTHTHTKGLRTRDSSCVSPSELIAPGGASLASPCQCLQAIPN
jgi:hypothetical protein